MAIFKRLYIQVLIGIILAIVLGIWAPDTAVAMKPLGDGFIALLRMLLGPIIFCTVVLGMTHIADMRQLGRLALKALIYFEVLTTIGMLLGFVAVNVFRPGDGLHAAQLALPDNIDAVASAASNFTAVNFLLSIIPHTLTSAFVDGSILQVLFVSTLVAVALSVGGVGKDSVIIRGISEGQDILFKVLGFIMLLAPIGAFGAMAAAIGAFGAETLVYLAKVVILYWLTATTFVIVVLGTVCAMAGFSIFTLLRLIRDEFMLVLGTASGEVVLPRLLRKFQQAGCDQSIVGFVLPAGYSFNLDGTGIYMAIAVAFIAQATDTPFTLAQQLGVLVVMLFSSKGGTAVAGGAFIKLAATMQTVQALPLGGLGLLFGVDRFMSTCTALTNIVGNTVAVFVIAKWEGKFNRAEFDEYLRQQKAGLIDSSGGETEHVLEAPETDENSPTT